MNEDIFYWYVFDLSFVVVFRIIVEDDVFYFVGCLVKLVVIIVLEDGFEFGFRVCDVVYIINIYV